MMPPKGVKPIDVATHLPSLIAVIDAPEPIWQEMILLPLAQVLQLRENGGPKDRDHQQGC